MQAGAAAKPEKVLMCHYTTSTTNPYNLISVSANAVPDHEAHGDHRAVDCGSGPQCTPCLPEVCTLGWDGMEWGDPWTICRIDESSAWLSSTGDGAEYDPIVACLSLGYSRVGQYGGNCGNVCGYCREDDSSCTDPGTENYDGGNSCDFDGESGTLCFGAMWECLA